MIKPCVAEWAGDEGKPRKRHAGRLACIPAGGAHRSQLGAAQEGTIKGTLINRATKRGHILHQCKDSPGES